MIAIGVRRNIQITPEGYDFDQGGLEEADFLEERETSQVYNSTTKRVLSSIVVAQCALAVAQTATMMTAYRADQDPAPQITSISQLLASMAEIERADTELAVWARRFKIALQGYSNEAQHTNDTNASETLFAEMTLIHY